MMNNSSEHCVSKLSWKPCSYNFRTISFKGLTANAADRDTDGDVEAEAKGEAEAEDQQVLIATLDLQGGMLSIF